MSEHHQADSSATTPDDGEPGFRPRSVAAVPLSEIAEVLGVTVPEQDSGGGVTGISLNSRAVEPGDLYMALPGASRHGADFVPQAVDSGAVAVVTDDAGARRQESRPMRPQAQARSPEAERASASLIARAAP